MEIDKLMLLALCCSLKEFYTPQLKEKFKAISDTSSVDHWLADFVKEKWVVKKSRGWYLSTDAGLHYVLRYYEQLDRLLKGKEDLHAIKKTGSVDTSLRDELILLWQWSNRPKNVIENMINKLLKLNSDGVNSDLINNIYMQLFGGKEEIPPNYQKTFDSSVERTIELLLIEHE